MSRREQIKDLFTFTKGERNGVFFLFVLILILISVYLIFKFAIKQEKYDFSEFEKEIREFDSSRVKMNENVYQNKLDNYIQERYDTLKLFEFNPNTIDKNSWKLLGLTKKQIKTISNYISKGGKFIDKDDLKEIYGIRFKQYQILKPYIQLPERKNNRKKNYNSSYFHNNSKKPDFSAHSDSLFTFDPNNTNRKEWKSLGFSDKQINTINKYLAKGARFKKKEDLKKIYVINEEQYKKVEEYIVINEDNVVENKKEKVTDIIIDINNLNESQLKELGGFWKYIAKNTIKFRELLGGFYMKEQLKDVYGMKPEFYNRIVKSIKIDKSRLFKIRLNFADKSELAKHPYISWDIAKKIVKHRDRKGPYKKLTDILEAKLVSKLEYTKIKNYLTVE